MRNILAFSLLCVSLSAHAVDYQVQLLPALSSGGDSFAYGMNDNGMVVGQSYNATTGKKEAVVWNNGVVASLGVEGIARAVNNSGTVVGETGGVLLGFPTGRAFMWQGSGPVSDIGDLGGTWAGAYDINESGVITGFSCTNYDFTCVFQSSGFRYDSGTMTNLGTVSSPSGYSRGHGMNDLGEIVGRGSLVDFAGSEKHMVYWDSSNNLTSVVGPETYSTAQDINNSGIIVGNGYDANGDTIGLVWDENQNLVKIMDSFGGVSSYGYSINDLGVVVGWASDAAEQQRAMVSYDGGQTTLDLNALAIDLGDFASLDVAYDVSENGDIVGLGTLSTGEKGAFLLTATVVPLPAAAWLFISAFGVLVGFRRRT